MKKIIYILTLYNVAGQLIETYQEVNNARIDIGNSLASGLYYLLIQSEAGVQRTKIIKQ